MWREGLLEEESVTYRRQKQQMLVIALHTGLAVFTYRGIRYCREHVRFTGVQFTRSGS